MLKLLFSSIQSLLNEFPILSKSTINVITAALVLGVGAVIMFLTYVYVYSYDIIIGFIATPLIFLILNWFIYSAGNDNPITAKYLKVISPIQNVFQGLLNLFIMYYIYVFILSMIYQIDYVNVYIEKLNKPAIVIYLLIFNVLICGFLSSKWNEKLINTKLFRYLNGLNFTTSHNYIHTTTLMKILIYSIYIFTIIWINIISDDNSEDSMIVNSAINTSFVLYFATERLITFIGTNGKELLCNNK